MCEFCGPQICGKCGSEFSLCPVCEYQVCSSEPEHYDHFERPESVLPKINDVTNMCSLCGMYYRRVSEGHDYVKCVERLYKREESFEKQLRELNRAKFKALSLRDKQVSGEINAEFNFGGPLRLEKTNGTIQV